MGIGKVAHIRCRFLKQIAASLGRGKHAGSSLPPKRHRMLSTRSVAVPDDLPRLIFGWGRIVSFEEAEEVIERVLQEAKHVRCNQPKPHGDESFQNASRVVADSKL